MTDIILVNKPTPSTCFLKKTVAVDIGGVGVDNGRAVNFCFCFIFIYYRSNKCNTSSFPGKKIPSVYIPPSFLHLTT